MSQKTSSAVVVNHRVTDYATWKRAFDGHEPARRAAGIVGHHINRGVDDPNMVSIYLAATDATKLEAFLASPDLKAVMAKAGVEGAPTITLLQPDDDRTVRRDPLFGAIVSHEVADYAAWKRAYDADDASRTRAGIIGSAVNRVAAQPGKVVVYLQAERREQLESFTSSPDLKETMKRAGVMAPPMIAMVKGDGWATY